MFGTKANFSKQTFTAGALIMQEGARATDAYVIESGKVEIFTKNDDGSENIIGTLGQGQIFGEMALIMRDMRSASVRAVEDTVVSVISGHDLVKSMSVSSWISSFMMNLVNDRMSTNNMRALKKPEDGAGSGEAPPPPALLEQLRSAIQKLYR